jgi:tetratricopeptide (TPR) repeat protein
VNPEDPLARDKAAEMRNAVGSSFMLAGRAREARAEFERAYEVGIPAEKLVARSNLGYASFVVDSLDAAEADWTWALERDPRNPDLHYNIGQIRFRRSDMAGAEAAYRQALRWEPNYSDVLNALAWLLAVQARNLDEAASLARRAVALDPAPNNLDTLGYALLAAGKVREGRSVLERAGREAPASPEISFHLALARSRDGDTVGAMDAARRSLQIDPRGANAAAAAELLRSLETGANR